VGPLEREGQAESLAKDLRAPYVPRSSLTLEQSSNLRRKRGWQEQNVSLVTSTASNWGVWGSIGHSLTTFHRHPQLGKQEWQEEETRAYQ
jgi:hypothetical protein